MKKLLALMLALVVATGLVACSGGGGDEGTPEEKIAASATKGTIAVEVVSAQVTKDKNGADAVVVTYNFTNNTDKKRDFRNSVDVTVNQGTEKLKGAIVPIGDVYKDSVSTKSIDPETSLEVYVAYVLVDTTTPLNVTCNIKSGEDKATIEKELTIA